MSFFSLQISYASNYLIPLFILKSSEVYNYPLDYKTITPNSNGESSLHHRMVVKNHNNCCNEFLQPLDDVMCENIMLLT